MRFWDSLKKEYETGVRTNRKNLEFFLIEGVCCSFLGVFFLIIALSGSETDRMGRILVGLAMAAGGITMLVYRHKTMTKWEKYEILINPQYGSISLDNLSKHLGISKEKIVADLKKMMKAGYYPGAFFDYTNSRFIIDVSNPNIEEIIVEETHYEEPEIESIQDELARLISSASDGEVKNKLKTVDDLYNRVLKKKDESEDGCVNDIDKFESLYIPKTIEIVERFQELSAGGDNSTREEVIGILDSLTTGIINLLAEMTSHEQIDLSSEIDALKTMLSLDGYDRAKSVHSDSV